MKKKMKVLLLALTLVTSSVATHAVESTPHVQNGFVSMWIDKATMNVNGQEKEVDTGRATAPILRDGRTLLPLRAVVEALGGTVVWNATDKSITASNGDKKVVLTIDNPTAEVNGGKAVLDVAPVIVNERTMLPIRFVAENLGWSVHWDGTQKLVMVKQSANPLVTIEMENGKLIHCELYPSLAPNTVNNFISLISKKFYDGLIFHRVIPEFVIQGGDPTGTGTGGPGYSIHGEFIENGFKQNTLSHTKGVLSMARASDANSAGSQFFIMAADYPKLDGQYAAFGKALNDGSMAVVEEIVSVERNRADKPLTEQKMKRVTVDTFGVSYGEPVKVQ